MATVAQQGVASGAILFALARGYSRASWTPPPPLLLSVPYQFFRAVLIFGTMCESAIEEGLVLRCAPETSESAGPFCRRAADRRVTRASGSHSVVKNEYHPRLHRGLLLVFRCVGVEHKAKTNAGPSGADCVTRRSRDATRVYQVAVLDTLLYIFWG